MAREFREFRGAEGPVQIADGKESPIAESRTDIRIDQGRRHLLVDSDLAAHFSREAAAFSGFAVERVPPESFPLLYMA